VNFDAGFLAIPWSWLVLGGYGVNLYGTKNVPTQGAVLGATINLPKGIRLSGDAPVRYRSAEFGNTRAWGYNFAGEFLFSETLVLRGGYAKDPIQQQQGWATGLGWIAPKLKLQYSYGQGTKGTEHWASMTLLM
jgi:hypothetical protein